MIKRTYTVVIVAGSVKTYEDVWAVSEIEAVRKVLKDRWTLFPNDPEAEYLGGNGSQGFYKCGDVVLAVSIPQD